MQPMDRIHPVGISFRADVSGYRYFLHRKLEDTWHHSGGEQMAGPVCMKAWTSIRISKGSEIFQCSQLYLHSNRTHRICNRPHGVIGTEDLGLQAKFLSRFEITRAVLETMQRLPGEKSARIHSHLNVH